jgi:hypothetical protein
MPAEPSAVVHQHNWATRHRERLLRKADATREEVVSAAGTRLGHRPTRLELDSRRYLASSVLFNQAVADHLGLHSTDVQCLNLLDIEPGPCTTGRIAERTGLTSARGDASSRGRVDPGEALRSL